MRVAYIIHDPTWVDSGVVDELRRRGHEIDFRCPAAGDQLPVVGEHSVVVVGGGLVSVYRADEHRWMADEIAYAGAVHAAGVPYLGMCLGAQILAATDGVTSVPRDDHVAEFGFFPIEATDAGASLFADFDVAYQVHYEGLDRLPTGSELLASSDLFPYQAYRWGSAIGVQFHPDCRADTIADWWTDYECVQGRPGVQALEEQLRVAPGHEPKRIAFVERLIDHLLD